MLPVPKLGTRISIIKDRKQSNNSLTCRRMFSRKVYDVQNTLFRQRSRSVQSCRTQRETNYIHYDVPLEKLFTNVLHKKKRGKNHSIFLCFNPLLFFLFLRVHTYDMLKKLKFQRLKEVSLEGLAQHCDNPSSTFLQISDLVSVPRVNVVGPTCEGVSASQNLSTIPLHDERVNQEDFLIAKSLT